MFSNYLNHMLSLHFGRVPKMIFLVQKCLNQDGCLDVDVLPFGY